MSGDGGASQPASDTALLLIGLGSAAPIPSETTRAASRRQAGSPRQGREMWHSVAMKTALAIRHVAFEDLGSLEDELVSHGYRVRYVEAGMEDLAEVKRERADLLVVLGGPIGAYAEADYPFLQEELSLLEGRLAADLPTLGICLGSQLMARALGARVYPGGQKEIGWGPLVLTEAGRRSCLAMLAPEHTAVLHWHGDTFDLPARATRLASTELYANQAFTWGRRALALQFHAEVTARGLERWFIGHACELVAAGVSVPKLRSETSRWVAILQAQSRRWFERWLSDVDG